MKCLVVKANGHEARKSLGETVAVSLQTAFRVHGSHIESRLDQQQVTTHVGHRPILRHHIRVVTGERADTPWPMILEAATHQPNAVGPQRARKHVSVVSVVFFALEAEANWSIAINPLASSWRQSATHHS